MKKAISIWCILLAAAILLIPCCAFAGVEEDLNDAIDDGLENIDFSQVQQYADGTLVDDVVAKVKQILSGEYDDADTFLQFIVSVFFDGIKSNLPSLVAVFVIAVLCSLLTKNSSLVSSGIANIIYLAGFSVIAVSLLTVLYGVYGDTFGVVGRVSEITDAAMPIILTLMIANGNNVTAKVCQPMVGMLTGTVVKAISGIILPLCAFSLVFCLISNLSDNVKVTKMSKFLSNGSSWLLGTIFMVFTAFLSVQGITAATVDGVSIRAARFATKNYVPLLGGYLADGFDLVVAGSTLIKNSFGVVTLLLLFAQLLAPVMTILTYKFGLQLITAFAEPVCDAKFISFFSGINKNLTFLAVVLVAIGFMFFIMIMLVIYTANV